MHNNISGDSSLFGGLFFSYIEEKITRVKKLTNMTTHSFDLEHFGNNAGLKEFLRRHSLDGLELMEIGEDEKQILQKEGRLPDAVIACVGGGSNAIGSFYHFIEDKKVRLIGCEAAGRGIDTDETAATITTGRLGIFHGMKSYFCQDEYGQIAPVYSISAGLDYPGVGPEHAYLHDMGRAEYVPVTDEEAVWAFEYLAKTEGIIPAIESAHAVAHAMKVAPLMSPEKIIVVTISGRGDKDCAAIARYRGEDIYE